MLWGKRVIVSFVLSLMLIPAVSAQFVADFVSNLGDVLSFFIDTHIADFVLYFSVFFVVMKQALEKIWKKKDLTVNEKDAHLVNVVSFVVSAILTLSLVYWSVTNNFTLMDFGPWMFVLFAGAFGIMVFRWVASLKGAKPGEKGKWFSNFSFFNAMFLLFMLILALKFFSPQFLGVDILSGWPFSDVVVIGALALIVFAVVMNIMQGMKQAEGKKTGIVGFFTSDWGKNIGAFILWLLAFVILLYFIPWWAVALIAAAVMGYKLWKRKQNAESGSASSSENNDGGGDGNDSGGRGRERQAKAEQDVGSSEGLKIQSMHAFPKDMVEQGQRVRLDVLVVGGSGDFEYHWYGEDGKEIRRKDVSESALRINTMELPHVSGDGERGWLGNTFLGLRTKFLPSSEKLVRKYTVLVLDRKTKKIVKKSMNLTVLPSQEKLVFLKIINPVSSGRTLTTGMGNGEIPLTWKLKDPFGEVASVVWFMEPQFGEATDADLKNILQKMDVPDEKNNDVKSGSISFRKENLGKFGHGMYTIFVQGYDHEGKRIDGLQDKVFLNVENTVVAEKVIITKIDGQAVTRAASLRNPVVFDIGKVKVLEAEWVQQQDAEVHWMLVVADPEQIVQNVQRKGAHTNLGFGLRKTINLGNDLQPFVGKEFFLVAVPTKVTLGNIAELSETGFDYVKVVFREHSMVKVELYAPFASQRKENPTRVPLRQEFGIMYALTDPQQKVTQMHWVCTDERGKEVMVEKVSVKNSMRGEQKTQSVKLKEAWNGPGFLTVEAWNDNEMLDRASCWIAVQEEVQVVLKPVQGMERTKWKGRDMSIINYGQEVVFACDVTNPDAVESYTWIMHQAGKKGEILSRTEKPQSDPVKFKTNDVVPGEYDIRVDAVNKEKRVVAFDEMHITLREVTVTPYLIVNGNRLYGSQRQAIPAAVGSEVEIKGGIQETLDMRGRFVVTMNGEKLKVAEKDNGTKIKFVLPEAGIYTVAFEAYAPDIQKEGIIEVKIEAVETQKRVA